MEQIYVILDMNWSLFVVNIVMKLLKVWVNSWLAKQLLASQYGL